MKKIIFVCTGGTCRSPMAAELLKNKLKTIGVTNINVISAGIMANELDKTNDFSILALKQFDIKAHKKNAKQLTKKLITKNTLVISMTTNQFEYIKNIPNAHCITEFWSGGEIPDPYGLGEAAYIKTAQLLNIATGEILNKIVKGEI